MIITANISIQRYSQGDRSSFVSQLGYAWPV